MRADVFTESAVEQAVPACRNRTGWHVAYGHDVTPGAPRAKEAERAIRETIA